MLKCPLWVKCLITKEKKKQKAVTLRSTEYQWFSKSGLSGFEKKVEKRKKKKVRWSIRLKDLGICSCFGHLGFFALFRLLAFYLSDLPWESYVAFVFICLVRISGFSDFWFHEDMVIFSSSFFFLSAAKKNLRYLVFCTDGFLFSIYF